MATTALHEVATALTAAVEVEVRAAEALCYRLTTVRLLLDAAEPELLHHGLAELELAAEELAAAGRRRDRARGQVADRTSIPCELTLAELTERVPEPWSRTLEGHHHALRGLVERMRRAAASDGARGRAALDGVRHRLGTGPAGRHLAAVTHPRERQLVDDLDLAGAVTELRVREVTYESLVDVMAALPPADLVAFVAPRPLST